MNRGILGSASLADSFRRNAMVGWILFWLTFLRANAAEGRLSVWTTDLQARIASALARESTNTVERILAAELASLPKNLDQSEFADVQSRSSILLDLIIRHLPTNSPVLLDASEHRARILIEMKMVVPAEMWVNRSVALYNSIPNASEAVLVRIYEDAERIYICAGRPSEAVELLSSPKFGAASVDDDAAMRFRSLQAECYLDLTGRNPASLDAARHILSADWQYYLSAHREKSAAAATTLHLLARTSRASRNPEEALRYAEMAWNLRKEILRPTHPDLASSERLYGEILASGGFASNAIIHLKRAIPVLSGTFGPAHIETISALQHLALAYQWRGESDVAEYWADVVLLAQAQLVRESAYSGDEAIIRFQLRRSEPLLLPGTLQVREDERLAVASAVFKGLSARARVEARDLIRARADPRSRELVAQWMSELGNEIRCQRQLLIDPKSTNGCVLPKTLSSLEADLSGVGYHLGRINRNLALRNQEYWKRFPSNLVLVDFVLHAEVRSPDKAETRLDAVAYLPGSAPRNIRLPGNQEIPRLVLEYTEALRTGQGAGKRLVEISRELRERLWDPVAAIVPLGITNVVICPEGPLSYLSFSSLVKDDRLLGEDFTFRYIPSIAEVLDQRSVKPVTRVASLFANPDFDSKPALGITHRRDWTPLPDTWTECQELARLLTNRNWSVTVRQGEGFTKQAVLGVKEPGILLLATHGFWFPFESPYSASPGDKESIRWAMRNNGIVVSGANWRVNAVVDPTPKVGGFLLWHPIQNGSLEANPEGYLTAGDIEESNLSGTWLAILSGCSTGRGEFGDGDELFGLQRAVFAAGARNILLTAWPVWSSTTARLLPAVVADGVESGDLASALSRRIGNAMRHERMDNQSDLDQIIRRYGPYMLVTREL